MSRVTIELVPDIFCFVCRDHCVWNDVDQRTPERAMNKYWKKLCTPEQNARQYAALKLLASGLTLLFVIWFLGKYI